MSLARALAFSLFAVLALIVLAAIGVFVKLLALFFTLILLVALIPLLVAAAAWLKIQSKQRADVNRGRASVLKHVWEERQHREW